MIGINGEKCDLDFVFVRVNILLFEHTSNLRSKFE